MALVAHNFNEMGIRSTVYVFQNAGDELPLHVHEALDHISIVTHGTAEFFEASHRALAEQQAVLVQKLYARHHWRAEPIGPEIAEPAGKN